MARYQLIIDMDNVMRTSLDVALALRETADYLEGMGQWEDINAGNIRDLRGNPVGEWEYDAHAIVGGGAA